eukprot:5179826-Alexandrium_andersonii.AAC.1
MSASLVGSEMCIRDRHRHRLSSRVPGIGFGIRSESPRDRRSGPGSGEDCLLYTSDAADDM